jgi:formamidopyrimidine-DNA glycosylase
MPELPEVQAHAERLDAAFAGAVLDRFTPISFTALKTFRPDPPGRAATPSSTSAAAASTCSSTSAS